MLHNQGIRDSPDRRPRFTPQARCRSRKALFGRAPGSWLQADEPRRLSARDGDRSGDLRSDHGMQQKPQNHTLLIHSAFASSEDPGGTRHFELGKRLVAGGHRFTVVTSDVNYLTGELVVPRRKLITESYDGGIRILRTLTYSSLHASYLQRIVAFLSFMTSSVVGGLWAGEPDIVMGTTPPIFQAVSAWFLARLRRRPFLLEVRDLWPEFAVDIGLMKNRAAIWASRQLESFLYRHADHILVNSPAYREYLITRGVAECKVTVIPNGVEAGMFNPDDRGEEFRERYGLRGKFVVTYAGAIGMANDIGIVLESAERLRHRDDIRIVIVGEGKERKRLETRASERGLHNLIFTGAFPKAQMPQVLAGSDACIAILRNIKMFTTTYPNKVFDYMAAGRPTILAIDGVIRQVIEAARGGVFVPPGQPDQLAAVMEAMADSPDASREMGRNAREYVIRNFDRDQQARDFREILCRIAAGTNPESRATLAAADL
jgi:glycosyltransferase involved in cell wall biosynthesis